MTTIIGMIIVATTIADTTIVDLTEVEILIDRVEVIATTHVLVKTIATTTHNPTRTASRLHHHHRHHTTVAIAAIAETFHHPVVVTITIPRHRAPVTDNHLPVRRDPRVLVGNHRLRTPPQLRIPNNNLHRINISSNRNSSIMVSNKFINKATTNSSNPPPNNPKLPLHPTFRVCYRRLVNLLSRELEVYLHCPLVLLDINHLPSFFIPTNRQ